MKNQITFFSLLVLPMIIGIGGCDRLPESITGRPDPNAATIAPAGPTASNHDRDKMVAIETPSLETSFPAIDVAPSPFASNLNPPASGLHVPPAENPVSASLDGKIQIDSAHLRFVNDLEVAAQADGLIMQLDAEEGDLLLADSLMIQLDDRLAHSELEVTKKEYEAALEKSKDTAEIEYSKAAHDVAKEEYKIALEIDRKGAGTATELSKKWLEARRASLAITVAEVKNKQDVLAVGVSSAKQNAANVQVELRKILAPFDGIVAEKRKEKHDWVRAGDVILRLVSMEQLKVVGQVRVAQLSAAPHELLGKPANIKIELFPGKVESVTAMVNYVSPVMESSGGYRIWLKIPNMKSNDQWIFWEGMPAKIEIATR